MKIGAIYLGYSNYEFVVWAPLVRKVELKIVHPYEGIYPMFKDEEGYWKTTLEGIQPGTQYLFRINDETDRPDPASNFQPLGVHGPSQVVQNITFPWEDESWLGISFPKLIIYEIHIGTFTPEGTFDSAITKLDYLTELGITAVEVMPVSQFPGSRNWGYDGVYPFAPQNSYGGTRSFKRFIQECHKRKLAVILDVVYNHFGPEGNYLREFAPYFTDRYKTPWGDALNFDGEYSDGVRNFFIENVKHWLVNYHIDGLRLDAIDKIYDNSANHILKEIAENVKELNLKSKLNHFLIAESDLNDDKIIRPLDLYGYGLDAQWSDDFHHSVHSILTGETGGYYSDFGTLAHLEKSLSESFFYSGVYSTYRKRRHGNKATERPPYKFIVSLQNHDQVGNRGWGERLATLVSFEALKVSAGLLLLSPYVPLLYMGEEYGETNPFLYFVDHSNLQLMDAVKSGRREEFRAFQWQDEVPDPTIQDSFKLSKLNWGLKEKEQNAILLNFYKALINLRRNHPALINSERHNSEFIARDELIFMRRSSGNFQILAVYNFNKHPINTNINTPSAKSKKIFDSAEVKWSGKGTSLPEQIENENEVRVNELSFALYELESKL